MKNHIKPVLLIFFMLIIFLASTGLVSAFSETFQLVENGSASKIISANQGEHIIGSFRFLNMPSWIDSYTGDPTTPSYSFKIFKLAKPDILVYEAIRQEQDNFDVTCEKTGNYIIRFNVGNANHQLGNAQGILTYQLITPTPTATPESVADYFIRVNVPIILGILISTLILTLGFSVYYLKSLRNKPKNN